MGPNHSECQGRPGDGPRAADSPCSPAATAARRALLLLVLGVGIFLRVADFTSVPRGLLYDEGYNGIDAVKILEGARPLFLPANYGREALIQYLQAFSISAFGRTDWAMRVPGVAFGLLALPASYLVIRRLFGARVAVLTAAWLAVSFWHLLYSRMGLRTIALPVALAAAFYCLWRGLDGEAGGRGDAGAPGQRDAGTSTHVPNVSSKVAPGRRDLGTAVGTVPASRRPRVPPSRGVRGAGWFALSGFFLGASLYTYTPARFAPLVVLAFAGYLAVARRDLLRRALPGLALAAVVALGVFAPEGWYFLHHPGDFVERADAVSVFNESLNQGDAARTLVSSAGRYLGMFTFAGDPQWDRDIPGRPIFDPASSVLLGLGLARLLRDARRSPRAGFVLLWLAIMLVPGILAARNAPNTLRVTGLIPAIFALPALGADWLWSVWDGRAGPLLRLAPFGLVGLGVVAGGVATYHDYFDYWARTRSVSETWDADRWTAVDLGKRLAARTGADVFVGGGDPDGPVQTYALIDDPVAPRVHVFDGLRSLIFPTTDGPVPYVFAQRDLPTPAVLGRYFVGPTSAVSATAPGGDAIRSYTLRPGRGAFEPDHPLAARFADALQIYGFDYPTDVPAGATVAVRWYWKIVGPTPRELAFFNQVYDDSDTRRGQLDDRAFAPDYWPVGTTGISTFDVPIDPDAPTGPAALVVGVYTRSDLARLPVVDGNGDVVGTQLTLGPIKVHGRPPPAVRTAFPALTHFGDGVDLLGYDLQPAGLHPGASVTLTLSWSARARPAADYTVFVHLLDARGAIVAQADAPPRSGRYPTSLWDPGETIADPHQLTLGPDLPPGRYRVEVGLYVPATGQRLAVVGPGGAKQDDRVLVGELLVR